MIFLERFGEMISKQEWVARKGKTEYFTYLGKNKAYAGDNFIVVSGNRRKNCGFDCSVSVPEDKSQKDVYISTANIYSLAYILSVADAFRTGGEDAVPLSVYSYITAKEKDDETFRVEIDPETIFEIDKDHKLIVDKKYFAEEEANSDPLNFVIHYEFHDRGIYAEEPGESKSYVLNDEKSCVPECSNIEMLDIIKNPVNSTSIPNLTNLPKVIQFFNNEDLIHLVYVDYDEYGLMKNCDHCLYEAYITEEFEFPYFAASLHPFYYDNFNSEILPGIDKFCVEQIDRMLDVDDDAIIYSREIYEVKDEEKRKELIKLIDEAKKKNEPCIPIIE